MKKKLDKHHEDQVALLLNHKQIVNNEIDTFIHRMSTA